jgi:subtilase family serine protease
MTSHGFTVNVVYPSATVIDFSGSARQVREAFHTEVHNLLVNGVHHIANMTDPQIPAALSRAVVGIVSLHDFSPRPMRTPRTDYTFTSGGSTFQALVPADLATIYNLNPLFSAGVSGQGQTVVVIEDTNVFTTTDWTTFRSRLGLSTFTGGSFTQVHPAPLTGTNNCRNPGDVVGNDGEAILDAEWASAAAPSAAIELASCADTTTTFGGLIAIQNLINASSSPPAIMSVSYGECEAVNGATANAAFVSAYQQAAAEGVSVFVSSGDEGAASCDADEAKATHGIGVSGFASTPYNVAVGGTDFGDSFAGTNATYWNSTNTATFGSARSYIPEIPWNDSCASTLLTTAEGFTVPYGTAGFCNSTTGRADFLSTASGSGGPSGCATGTASTAGVVSGTCAGTAKPSWQSGILGNPADGVRDIPDVSLFAANGVWGHYYVYCYTNTSGGGASCAGAPSTWAGAGGTSFSSPILAGIQALVNQHTGARWGNPNPTYYSLAKTEYGTVGSASCNSTSGNGTSTSCIFYDTTQGDMDVNCTGTHNCYRPSGTNGVLSTSTTSYAPAYRTTTGWDFATGIGTVNAFNLVMGWP